MCNITIMIAQEPGAMESGVCPNLLSAIPLWDYGEFPDGDGTLRPETRHVGTSATGDQWARDSELTH